MKNILVIGAGRGIGLDVVKALKNNYHVYAISRTPSEELEKTGVPVRWEDALAFQADAGFLPDVLHGVVYCPGSISLKPFNRFSLEDFENDFRQNVLGAVHVLQKVLPLMKKANGASYLKANQRAAHILFPCELVGNKLQISSGFSFPAKDRLRDQEVVLHIEVPNGKVVLHQNKVVYPYFSESEPDQASDRAYVYGDGEYSAW